MVVVEVVHSDDRPAAAVGDVQRGIQRQRLGAVDAVHLPDAGRAGLAVVPKDVRLLITVELPRSEWPLPGRVQDVQRRVQRCGAEYSGPIHVPNTKVPGPTAVPKDINVAVLVEVARADHASPGAVDSVVGRIHGGGADSGDAIHKPDV